MAYGSPIPQKDLTLILLFESGHESLYQRRAFLGTTYGLGRILQGKQCRRISEALSERIALIQKMTSTSLPMTSKTIQLNSCSVAQKALTRSLSTDGPATIPRSYYPDFNPGSSHRIDVATAVWQTGLRQTRPIVERPVTNPPIPPFSKGGIKRGFWRARPALPVCLLRLHWAGRALPLHMRQCVLRYEL